MMYAGLRVGEACAITCKTSLATDWRSINQENPSQRATKMTTAIHAVINKEFNHHRRLPTLGFGLSVTRPRYSATRHVPLCSVTRGL